VIRRLRISRLSIVSALGRGLAAHHEALSNHRSGLRPNDFPHVDLQTWIGRVDGLEDEPLQGDLAAWDCRNNRLGMVALQADGMIDAVEAAIQRYGADRIGVFMGTSTSGIQQTEWAYRHRESGCGALPGSFSYEHSQNIYSIAGFTRAALGLQGPAQVISTACSSSAKVFATAWRYMNAGLCDAAVVGGVDSLCRMTLYGFNALQLVSAQPCRPADQDRDGINIGEAGGYALLEWANEDEDALCLLGYGESSDAYHMSTPHPEGEGARQAMQQALDRAGLDASQVDYVNLHGTATPANDRSEDQAVIRVLGEETPCSSTKGFTGHTLGAAGILEAAVCCIAIEQGLMPASINTETKDETIRANILLEARHRVVSRVMSNSFGFGGSNAALLIGRVS
jgi:3-oxoacyl-[acyl-carrier-protein] synthase-1